MVSENLSGMRVDDGDASSSRAAAAPSARFDMMMNGSCCAALAAAFAEPGLQVDRLPSQAHQRGCLGQHLRGERCREVAGSQPHKKKVDIAVDPGLNLGMGPLKRP